MSPDEVPYLLDLHLFLGRTLTTSGEDGNLLLIKAMSVIKYNGCGFLFAGVFAGVLQSVFDGEEDFLRHAHSQNTDLVNYNNIIILHLHILAHWLLFPNSHSYILIPILFRTSSFPYSIPHPHSHSVPSSFPFYLAHPHSHSTDISQAGSSQRNEAIHQVKEPTSP